MQTKVTPVEGIFLKSSGCEEGLWWCKKDTTVDFQRWGKETSTDANTHMQNSIVLLGEVHTKKCLGHIPPQNQMKRLITIDEFHILN